jgi:hypothetical protein
MSDPIPKGGRAHHGVPAPTNERFGSTRMTGRSYLVRRGDSPALQRAATALREWDPCWDLDVPDRHARVYDADGTLYALCVGDTMSARHNHRECRFVTGDLVIIPREFALDIEPEVGLLALRHSGAAPDHFRERFIQVWGFEHLAASDALVRDGDIVPPDDARYPLAYSVWLTGEKLRTQRATGLECALAVSFGDVPCRVSLNSEVPAHELARGDALLLGPGLEFAVDCEGPWGLVILFNELSHQGRRLVATAAGRPPGPEFIPPPRGPH